MAGNFKARLHWYESDFDWIEDCGTLFSVSE